MKIILQKVISASGYSSRRKAEELIKSEQVEINGQLATIGDYADPTKDKITINGHLIPSPAIPVYIKLNKPLGYTCTNRIFPGEKNIFDLVRIPERLFVVGRLDKDSRGLVLLTNDGNLTQRLAHPKFQHEKVYEVKTEEKIERPDNILAQFKYGLNIGEEDGVVRVKDIKYLQSNFFIITLSEGKKRQIRRMFKVLNLNITDLKRIKISSLQIGDLKEGKWKYLDKEEIKKLAI